MEETQQKLLFEQLGEALYSVGEDQNDPLLSKDFDLVNYFNTQYPDESCLENIVDEIKKYDEELSQIDTQIKGCIRDQAYQQEQTR